MTSTFFGLEIGRKALQAQQKALDVTAHNVANANTPGFTRQRAVMTTTTPYAYPSINKPIGAGQLGTGVEVQEVIRVKDDFIDAQIRKENTTTGMWSAKKDALSKLEVIFNEPSDAGLRTVLDQFWESLQQLNQKPEDGSTRAIVRQRGQALCDTFQHLDRQLTELQDDLDDNIEVKVKEINTLASQIRDLNEQIVKVEVSGDKANDLRDKRDYLVEQISSIAPVQVREDDYGAISVTIDGRAIVANTFLDQLTCVDNATNNGYNDIAWASDGTIVNVNSGTIKGMIDARDTILPNYRTRLDDMAATVVTEFNAVHELGFALDGVTTGVDFFDPTGTTAATIVLDPAIVTSYDNIAAALNPNSPGDGGNALDLAELKHQSMAALSGTMDDYYRGMAAQLGIESQEATRMVDNQTLLQSQLDNKRQEVSGVSLDEEMTNMIKFQHSYNAAARVVTAMDEMIEIIVSKLGLVGR